MRGQDRQSGAAGEVAIVGDQRDGSSLQGRGELDGIGKAQAKAGAQAGGAAGDRRAEIHQAEAGRISEHGRIALRQFLALRQKRSAQDFGKADRAEQSLPAVAGDAFEQGRVGLPPAVMGLQPVHQRRRVDRDQASRRQGVEVQGLERHQDHSRRRASPPSEASGGPQPRPQPRRASSACRPDWRR